MRTRRRTRSGTAAAAAAAFANSGSDADGGAPPPPRRLSRQQVPAPPVLPPPSGSRHSLPPSPLPTSPQRPAKRPRGSDAPAAAPAPVVAVRQRRARSSTARDGGTNKCVNDGGSSGGGSRGDDAVAPEPIPPASLGSGSRTRNAAAASPAGAAKPVVHTGGSSAPGAPLPWPLAASPPPPGAIKVASWNVASLRTVLRTGALDAYVAAENPDVLCLQETRLTAGGVAAVAPALPASLPWAYFGCSGDAEGVLVVGRSGGMAVAATNGAAADGEEGELESRVTEVGAAAGRAPAGEGDRAVAGGLPTVAASPADSAADGDASGRAPPCGAASRSPPAIIPSRLGRLGYSGTALLCRHPPLRVTAGLPLTAADGRSVTGPAAAADGEGRVLTAEFHDMVIVCVYVPNAGAGLVRLATRVGPGVSVDGSCGSGGGGGDGGDGQGDDEGAGEGGYCGGGAAMGGWDARLRAHVAAVAARTRKGVLLAGDMNVAHAAIDLANPQSNRRNAGFTPAERWSFSALVGPPPGGIDPEGGRKGRVRRARGDGGKNLHCNAAPAAPAAADAAGDDDAPSPTTATTVATAPPPPPCSPPPTRLPPPPPLLMVDTLRVAHPTAIVYTFWSSRRGGEARAKNVGWRLDYVLASAAAAGRVVAAWARPEVGGSDHAPVGVTIRAALMPPSAAG